VGARTVDQLDENVAAADLDLSDEQWDRIMDARYGPDGALWGH
jgi:aryl-alcohol dehydrogenase-like predicted oxidoreductase